LSSRLLMLLMLKVATLIKSLSVPVPFGCPQKKQTSSLFGLALFYRRKETKNPNQNACLVQRRAERRPRERSLKEGCRESVAEQRIRQAPVTVRAIYFLALNSATHPEMWIVCSSKCALSPASRSDCRSDKLLKIPFAL